MTRRRTVALCLGGLVAIPTSCSFAPESRPPATMQETEPQRREVREAQVGNAVPGFATQPDYRGMAQGLKERVENRLPTTIPRADVACDMMLTAVAKAYATQQDTSSPAVVVMAQTRVADFDACIRDTTPGTALCVALLIAEGNDEYPWLLDQCTRAFSGDPRL